jgi:hypothetical protein
MNGRGLGAGHSSNIDEASAVENKMDGQDDVDALMVGANDRSHSVQ